MTEHARFKLNLATGEVEIEGQEAFVERQIEQLQELIESLGLAANMGSGETHAPVPASSLNPQPTPDNDAPGFPASFGEWMHTFKSDINDLDKALITARYVQQQSTENDFKTSEVNKALKDHGIKLANPSVCLKRLADKKLMFQTRKVGSLRFMRVSVDGQNHLSSLKRPET
jgi:hypothetical protein